MKVSPGGSGASTRSVCTLPSVSAKKFKQMNSYDKVGFVGPYHLMVSSQLNLHS